MVCVKHSVNRAHRRRTVRFKAEAFDAYGGPVCKDCSIIDIDVLTLDHVDGGGNADRRARFGDSHRSGQSLYKALKAEGWPPGFAVRCFNCNWKRHHNTSLAH